MNIINDVIWASIILSDGLINDVIRQLSLYISTIKEHKLIDCRTKHTLFTYTFYYHYDVT